MKIIDIIELKRDGKMLSKEQIDLFIDEMVKGKVPDYQISAFLMASFINGMNFDETYYLTDAMLNSGETLDIKEISENSYDKHSTGGIGDKVSLILIPILSALGIPALKMSGRALGFTGGTIDKLESIQGFKIDLSEAEISSQVKSVGAVICEATKKFAIADKILYALRDVTATVESIPLIASSIMSKKLAINNKALIIDLKMGSGAFMKNIEDARKLAHTMKDIAIRYNRLCKVAITNMDAPLGYTIGNDLEIIETIQILKGERKSKALDISATLGAYVLKMLKGVEIEEGIRMINETIENHTAYEKLIEIVKAQGGDISYIKDESKFSLSNKALSIYADSDGYVKYDAYKFGKISLLSGCGREKKNEKIDYGAGILFNKMDGEYVKKGDILYDIYCNKDISEIKLLTQSASRILSEPFERQLIYEVI